MLVKVKEKIKWDLKSSGSKMSNTNGSDRGRHNISIYILYLVLLFQYDGF